jgi:hypothetical protein
MDAALLLALPLVGGLIFCSAWNVTRFRAAREEGHRLYFRVVFYGAILFVSALLGRAALLSYFTRYQSLEKTLVDLLVPMAKDAVSAAPVAQLAVVGMYAMLLAYPLAILLNLFVGRKRWLRQAMEGDDLEQLLYDGLTRRFPICITTGDNKLESTEFSNRFQVRRRRR